MNEELQQWVQGWFDKGEHDLRAAEVILHSDDAPYDMVCFHTQQCVEKYLKGFLTFHQEEVQRTHDLVNLNATCSRIDPSFNQWEEICEQLTDYAIETRYPDDLVEYSAEEAENAFASATRFRDFIKDKIVFNAENSSA